MKNIIVDNKNDGKKVVTLLLNQFNKLTPGTVHKALRNKDIRINNVKINENVTISSGDTITIYIKDEFLEDTNDFEINEKMIVYDDENIVIVNKPREISVESDKSEIGIDKYLREYYINDDIKPCHRLDRNTAGLIIFSKNEAANHAMLNTIKERGIRKYYRALVYGVPKQKSATLRAYLFKDSKNSRVIISDVKKKGYQEIITKYQLLNKNDDGTSLLEVELITGKTHQIRAHLAYIGLPIIGDGKYGINTVNKQFKKKYQELESYKITFENALEPLEYLNGKTIKI